MDKNRIKGKAKQIQGKVRDIKGDFTKDPTDDAAAKAKIVEGKVQEGVGKLKDAGRKAAQDAGRKAAQDADRKRRAA